MFRKGGNVGTGIMSGVVDRSMHAESPFVGDTDQFPNLDKTFNVQDTSENIGTEVGFVDKKLDFTPSIFTGSDPSVGESKSIEDHIAEVQKGAGPYGGMDPLTTFLLSAGPRVAGATSFSDAIQKLDVPAEKLMKLASDKANWQRGLRLKGLERAQAHDEKLDDRRWEKLQKADDRNWQQFLTQDERTYLQSVSQLDFYRQKGLIKDDRRFKLDLLKDEKIYKKMEIEDKRAWDERVAKRTQAFAKLDREAQQDFQREMMEAGNAFELVQIMKKFEQQKELIKIQTDATKLYTGREFMKDYENSTHANNRALYENEGRNDMNQTFGQENNGGFVFSEDGTGNSWQKKKEKKENIGKVFFNLNDGKYYKFDYGLKDGEKVTGWTVIDNLKDYKKPDPIEEGDVVKKNLLDQRVLTQKSAQKEADERGYILIGEAPKSYRRKGQEWIAEQKELLGPKAKTLREIQSIIRQEELDKKRKLLNKKGHRIK
jgi:hypothetical protein